MNFRFYSLTLFEIAFFLLPYSRELNWNRHEQPRGFFVFVFKAVSWLVFSMASLGNEPTKIRISFFKKWHLSTTLVHFLFFNEHLRFIYKSYRAVSQSWNKYKEIKWKITQLQFLTTEALHAGCQGRWSMFQPVNAWAKCQDCHHITFCFNTSFSFSDQYSVG